MAAKHKFNIGDEVEASHVLEPSFKLIGTIVERHSNIANELIYFVEIKSKQHRNQRFIYYEHELTPAYIIKFNKKLNNIIND